MMPYPFKKNFHWITLTFINMSSLCHLTPYKLNYSKFSNYLWWFELLPCKYSLPSLSPSGWNIFLCPISVGIGHDVCFGQGMLVDLTCLCGLAWILRFWLCHEISPGEDIWSRPECNIQPKASGVEIKVESPNWVYTRLPLNPWVWEKILIAVYH